MIGHAVSPPYFRKQHTGGKVSMLKSSALVYTFVPRKLGMGDDIAVLYFSIQVYDILST